MSQSIGGYTSLHAAWYELKKSQPSEDELRLYQRFMNRHTDRVLEPMCGAGRYLVPLARLGYVIDGFDASSAMLERCYATCRTYDIPSRIWCDMLPGFWSPHTYQCMFIATGSFGLISDRQEASQSLRQLYRYLAPGGVLLFGAERPAIAYHEKHMPQYTWKGDVCMYADGSYLLLYKMYLPMDDNVMPIVLWYTYISDNTCQQREVEYMNIRTYEPEEMYDMLKQAGFDMVKTCKAYDASREPDEHDVRVVYACWKAT